MMTNYKGTKLQFLKYPVCYWSKWENTDTELFEIDVDFLWVHHGPTENTRPQATDVCHPLKPSVTEHLTFSAATDQIFISDTFPRKHYIKSYVLFTYKSTFKIQVVTFIWIVLCNKIIHTFCGFLGNN